MSKEKEPHDPRLVKILLTEELLAAIDHQREPLSMNRSGVTRYLIRKGLATLGCTAEDVTELFRQDQSTTESD